MEGQDNEGHIFKVIIFNSERFQEPQKNNVSNAQNKQKELQSAKSIGSFVIVFNQSNGDNIMFKSTEGLKSKPL